MRCAEDATHWLVQPDGADNPGGWVCEFHGQRTVREFADKLSESWSLRPLRSEED